LIARHSIAPFYLLPEGRNFQEVLLSLRLIAICVARAHFSLLILIKLLALVLAHDK